MGKQCACPKLWRRAVARLFFLLQHLETICTSTQHSRKTPHSTPQKNGCGNAPVMLLYIFVIIAHPLQGGLNSRSGDGSRSTLTCCRCGSIGSRGLLNGSISCTWQTSSSQRQRLGTPWNRCGCLRREGRPCTRRWLAFTHSGRNTWEPAAGLCLSHKWAQPPVNSSFKSPFFLFE